MILKTTEASKYLGVSIKIDLLGSGMKDRLIAKETYFEQEIK